MNTGLAEYIAPTSQEYALVYCQYDALKGNRDWKQVLENGEIKPIDIAVAMAVMKKDLTKGLSKASSVTRAINVIYYGSPYSQSLVAVTDRIAYAEEILREILELVEKTSNKKH